MSVSNYFSMIVTMKLNYYLFVLWILASLATGGSLFFSEIMEFPPCLLCWYQRILMYPLAIIFLVAYFREDTSVFFYSLPFSILGLIISIYHNLIQRDIIPEKASPCVEGLSCADIWIEWFGFITIPFLSMTAFLMISIISLYVLRKNYE